MRKLAVVVVFLVILSLTFIFPAFFKYDEQSLSRNDDVSSRLYSMGYLDYAVDKSGSPDYGVRVYDVNRSYPGLNLFTFVNTNNTYLMDGKGTILHNWEVKAEKGWVFSRLTSDGNLFLLPQHFGLTNYLAYVNDKSNILWRITGNFHHDLFEYNNSFYSLYMEKRMLSDEEKFSYTLTLLGEDNTFRAVDVNPDSILDMLIVKISPEGEITDRISLYDLFQKNEDVLSHRELMEVNIVNVDDWSAFGDELSITFGDIFHANSVYVFENDTLISEKGDIMVCIRNQDLIIVFDPEAEKIKWWWGKNELDRPHHATYLENGNILVFDNGMFRNYSRVVEVNPMTHEIAWEYVADQPESFHTTSQGGAQRLPNGNTLITESNHGRVFEVTKDGEIVWEYVTPYLNDNRRYVIYRMERIPPEQINFLK
ncbi:MAG: arylsulfotransferase family protein [Candidatus Altiarchaeota archaeon]|nr:arylsulfotransferase family protein [Candidatus Altiarchaeota archaeon]